MSLDRTLEKLRAGEHVTIVALGDSNTATTFHTRGHATWVALLEEALFEAYGADACTLINAATCGSSSARQLDRLERDVFRYMPDCVIIGFGMNDALGKLDGIDAFKDRMRALVGAIRERCGSEILLRTPNPVVTVHGVPLPPEQPAPGKAWESERRPLAVYAAAIVGLGRELGCPVVDHYTLWTKKTFTVKHPVADPTGLWPRMADAIHPGSIGHLAFFRELAPFFEVAKYFPWEEVE
jgi:lysophospholipase L1-like esterase